ncbi:hypothetical protein RHSIM_Rhsim02G0211500 [Rhododendron simsii]|uniref:Reverse transcriptase n=1 Tax=Rhododendron simsii TaxID=118357 RepID=A0A834HA60_RHOSS|nr:hypothetical protein RHSIM_Rhsim02G0211500 [Rhododendron simsii]
MEDSDGDKEEDGLADGGQRRGSHAIEDILRKYEGASGQMVNREKSSLFFSPNTPNDVKRGISNFLNIRIETQGGKYLGLPSIVGKSKTEVFKYVSDRVLDRLRSWRDSKLNPAGKEVMIKSVASTMPNYVMQCFLLPKQVCRNLSCAIRKFWWGAKENENKISWVCWSKGGLGCRDIHAVNLAFLAKQGWRLLQGPRSLFQQLFKGSTFTIYPFGMPLVLILLLGSGEVLSLAELSSRRGGDGVWVMGLLLISGKIHGFLDHYLLRF